MYTIENRNNKGDMLIVAENQIWTTEDCKRLEQKENIFYNRGVFAIQKIERINNNPLLRIGIEDDGFISFNDHCVSFDVYWLNDLYTVLNKVTGINRKEN